MRIETRTMVAGVQVFQDHIAKNATLAYFASTGNQPSRSDTLLTLLVASLLGGAEARLVDTPDLQPGALEWG